MAKQEAAAIIVILLGLGLTQLEGGANAFYVGAGWGTIGMACLWLCLLIIKDLKRKNKKKK